MNKILKLTAHDGSDFGYLGLNSQGDRFIGGVNIQNATQFLLVKHSKDEQLHYFQIIDKLKDYLDISITGSMLAPVRPPLPIPVEKTTVATWKVVDEQLRAFVRGVDTNKVLGIDIAAESPTLYVQKSIQTGCQVQIIDAPSG